MSERPWTCGMPLLVGGGALDRMMQLPRSMEEYLTRWTSSERFSGYGMNTMIHMPCPFCATGEWLVYRILDSETALAKGATCAACGRSARCLFEREGGNLHFELVQTAGAEAPEWLSPRPRYLRATEGGD